MLFLIENKSFRADTSYEFFLPPKERIIEFTTQAKGLLGKKFENITQTRSLEKLRDTLLPKLMSGEARAEIGHHAEAQRSRRDVQDVK